MWDYSDTVKEHFFNPRNAGAVADSNAIGEVGSLSCGDALRLTLKVDPENETILDAGFQTFGCGSAIASSSALTEIIKGMTLDQALKVSNQDIADYLDGLPPEKMHCSVMGREALQSAVANYRGEVWSDDHEEGAMICKCFAVDEVLIEETIRANHLSSVEEVSNYTKAGGGCSACHEGIETILARVLKEQGRDFQPAASPAKAPERQRVAVGMPLMPKRAQTASPAEQPSTDAAAVATSATAPPASSASVAPPPGSAALAAASPAAATANQAEPSAKSRPKLSNLARIRRIEQTIESIRPNLQRDHGDIELIDVDGKNIFVKMVGACSGCQLAAVTLEGIQERICEDLGELVRVLPEQAMAVAQRA
ncbi:Fe-S cluster assembly protein NifU [Halochromatium roseum]|uniref:Fe-S cluster assembly protein NifU n=1 Tax=Halochromatium roseum TaxID=391920 RepID=UPI001F5D9291|nr:Fe-S cluster assembly protein NifU [Halochromatium roseum]